MYGHYGTTGFLCSFFSHDNFSNLLHEMDEAEIFRIADTFTSRLFFPQNIFPSALGTHPKITVTWIRVDYFINDIDLMDLLPLQTSLVTSTTLHD